MKKTFFYFAFVLMFPQIGAQQKVNVPQLLGYPAETKLLIIHADDIGLSQSTNSAVIKAFETESITSGSMMMPCPWAADFAAYAVKHHGLDIGIHFTLNAEWKYYKTGGVLDSCQIPGLLDKDGHLYPSIELVAQNAKAEEIEKELRAQINKAISLGVKPTHLDSHMGTMYATPQFFRVVVKVAKEYGLPVSLPFNLLYSVAPFLANEITADMVGVDNFLMLSGNMGNGNWNSMYAEMIKSLKPGLNEIVVHLSYDNPEMQAITVEHNDFGSLWRQNDLSVVTGEEFKKLLKENNIQLVTWKQVQEALYEKGK